MAFTSREINASPQQVFAVLADPYSYPEWLIGASHIRDVDEHWPAVGSKFHHLVGIKPVVIGDVTEVLDVVPDRSLRLKVKARPLVAAVATFRLTGGDGRCVVSLEEAPAIHTVGNIARPILDPVTHLRNHRSLRRLEAVVRGRADVAS